jgi:HD-GYP domain-containing protein (c-di-GMP phosphodiesterase class II)
MRWGDTTLSVSFCYGLAEIRDDSVHDTVSLLKQADLLLYEAKRNINTSLDRNAEKQVYFKNERPFLVDHVGNEAASNLTNRRYLHPDSKKVMSVNEKTYLPSQNDTVNGSKSSTAKLYEGLIRIQTSLVQQTKDGKPVSVSNISMVAEKVVALPEMIDALFNEAMFNPHEGEELALHSVIVFIYSLKLAQGLNCPNTKLVELGTSALAMDLGMFMLPQAYLAAKQDDLTPYEIDLIKRHPSLGYDLISEAGRKYKWLADVVRQTHEREDGSGYPRRLKGDQIHKYAKILAVTDTFVAMTHNRPYRPALLGFKAIQEILQSFKAKFDPRILRLLLTQLTVFPLKSYVKLNNGAIGMVVKTNESMILNPTIRILTDWQGRQVDEEKVMDLSKSPFLHVSEVVEEPI